MAKRRLTAYEKTTGFSSWDPNTIPEVNKLAKEYAARRKKARAKKKVKKK